MRGDTPDPDDPKARGGSGARADLPLIQLLPNLLTILAICAGLTAIRFAVQGNFETAVKLILVACVLDALDGKLARLLKSESTLGAELDSLADFVNFGVAPVLMIYIWALQDMSGPGWIAVLSFSVSCAIRLARFNVGHKSDSEDGQNTFFVGVPAPAGALLVMFPMFLSFALSDNPILMPEVIILHTICVALLMISRLPTYSIKNVTISRSNIKFFLLGMVFGSWALLTYIWATLVLFDLIYIVGLFLAWRSKKQHSQQHGDM
ncbi:CDP-diacylglycerol--serine O-phosphatidyltransferase [Litoreibacter roseus]|uniref:CDP-diacylglycerol--serine O-phosphatidyltransferase n=1 Tax=Litoreibacter roseus TaxID=2601869 RepID=A0A6N6JBJ3_9RHOB|nr:CDP-diacylglycerol--serine O-phosphatidyltransferase [Litoreibacter roseus]GFE63631.1 CDP-diacylglycerol--serine O-phosphatidyltransferase [Litoreibacter roseus]